MKLSDLDLNKRYSYADYYQWNFDNRVELINGTVYEMQGAPGTWHQVLVGKLHLMLGGFLNNNKECRVFIAPFDVRLPRKSNDDTEIFTVLQPDLCVVCDSAKIDRRGCLGAPDIVVEVLSPGNNVKELKNKFSIYEEAGVKEYWVVSPQNNSFVVNVLIDGRYITSRPMVAGDVITSALLPGFSIDLEQLFEGISYDDFQPLF